MYNKEIKIAIIGAGHMGGAIMESAIKAGYTNISVCDKNEKTLNKLRAEGITCTASGVEAISDANVIILAVKPNILEAVANEIRESIPKESVVISVCAGVSVERLKALFGHKKLLRVMPNMLIKVGEGMCVLCESEDVCADEFESAKAFIASFSNVAVLPEKLIDTVTGLSGSGPAYAYMLIEGMRQSGIRNGLDEESAKLLAAQTVLGAAKTVLEGNDSPAELIDRICTPNGTTIEAVKVFENSNLYGIIDEAIGACIRRSKELSHE